MSIFTEKQVGRGEVVSDGQTVTDCGDEDRSVLDIWENRELVRHLVDLRELFTELLGRHHAF
jgi:hypothetical protein